ncbi:MAG: hypothetical protein ABW049_01865, partial [Spongiibacteraceae bacterium]
MRQCRPLSASLAAVTFALLTSLCAAKPIPQSDLNWQPIQGKTASEVLEKLESEHFRKQRFDDVMSGQLLDNYLKSLDPTRLFLVRSDIDSFAKYRNTLDDALRKGN